MSFWTLKLKMILKLEELSIILDISFMNVGTLAKYTGGQVYYYPNFQSGIHGEKLRHELARDLTRETAWEAVMRIRCGKGLPVLLLFIVESTGNSMLSSLNPNVVGVSYMICPFNLYANRG